MPFYNGLDVLEAWEAETWSYPFIMITAFPNDEVRARIEQRGAILLAKPFAMADLRRAVARLAPSALEIIHGDSGSR
jgi:DNA-binding response OmpR family regulator